MKKTQKSFRKKALLSSLSMLLVSTVAVGSATFAWFTSNKTVTADTMKVKAAAAAGLQITKDNGQKFASKVSFSDNEYVLAPVSVGYTNADALSTNIGSGYAPNEAQVEGPVITTEGATKNVDKFSGWSARTMPNPVATEGTEAVANNTYYAAYRVGIKTTATDGSTLTGAKMNVKFTDTENKEYMRIAVIKQAANSTNYASDTLKAVYGATEANPTAVTSLTGDVPTLTAQKALTASEIDVDIDDVSNTPTYYTILVWFEGQDAQCVDDNQQATGSLEIKFTYESVQPAP
ncbi:MAG: hypothetical protein ACI4F2_02990 [Acutalibacteraceae bacterium]